MRLVATVLHALSFLLAQDDLGLEHFHRAANRHAGSAKRQRRHEPMPLVVTAKETSADRPAPTEDLQYEVPQPGLDVQYVGFDRVGLRIRKPVNLAISVALNVDLERVAPTVSTSNSAPIASNAFLISAVMGLSFLLSISFRTNVVAEGEGVEPSRP